MTELIAALAENGVRPQRGGGFRRGDNYTTCPQCSHTRKKKTDPCLSVTLDDNGGAVWMCHHCGWSGNVAGFLYRRASQDDRKPIRRPEPPKETPRPDPFWAFFDRRSIDREVVEEMGIYRGEAYFPQAGQSKPCIVFPYVADGVLVNNKYRSAQKEFAQDKDAERTLYNYDQIADDMLIWVEGEMDVLACLTAGYRSVVTLPDGAPKDLKDEDDPRRETDKRFAAMTNCADRLERIQRVVIATDTDEPGNNLAEELARRLGKERCWRARWPAGCKDANEVLTKMGVDVLRRCIESAKPYPVKSLHTAETYRDDVMALYRGEIQQGLTTGFENLDRFMKLTGTGQLVILTGIPNHGKSEFLDQILVNYCRLHGWRVAYCSFENNPPRHIAKLIEKVVKKPFRQYDGVNVTPMTSDEVEMGMEWVEEHCLFLRAEEEAPTIDWILEKTKAAVLRYGIKALVIDPYNEIEHKRPDGMTETEYLSQLLGKARRFGENHGVDMIFVAHPTKLQKNGDGQEPVPDLYDISGGAHWNNKADIGFAVWRDKSNPNSTTLVKVHKVRNKDLGQVGTADFVYHRLTGTYTEA
ncbi:DnaB-like helicase C-terminal domain-containing protein [Azospirillum sp.]|uniref:DnaB-like helicase C-terminal domain-containing protein n=1 Tax=Azospirillum sp. TaxID=34012 RepID=UPI003D72D329